MRSRREASDDALGQRLGDGAPQGRDRRGEGPVRIALTQQRHQRLGRTVLLRRIGRGGEQGVERRGIGGALALDRADQVGAGDRLALLLPLRLGAAAGTPAGKD